MTQIRSRKPIVNPSTNFTDLDDDEHWSRLHSSPPSSLSVNNSFTGQSSSATMGSWGFDVNRSANGQISSLSSNNNNDQQTIDRRRIPTTTTITTKGYNESFAHRSSSISPTEFLPRSTPTLTRQQQNEKEFSAIDRLVRGPQRIVGQTEFNPSNQSLPTAMNTIQPTHKTYTEQELFAWQNRMLEREQRVDNPSPKLNHQRTGNSSTRSSSRPITTSMRPISGVSNLSDNHPLDHNESTIKSARVIKRYIELLYHLQSFYERITDQLSNGNQLFKTNPTIFTNHCRRIHEQLQTRKPIWEGKLFELQNLLKDIASSSSFSIIDTETTFLQRRSNLTNLFQSLSVEKDLDPTNLSIRTDIEHVLDDDKLAVQLQDELSTLLQHQSLLNDFISLLQWNRSIYSPHEQTRVEHVLPLLREQMNTTDSYISHVSQQLTELVTKLRSSEKYILSYTNTVPSIDDAIVPSEQMSFNRGRERTLDETDFDVIRTRESRQINESSSKMRSISMPRFEDPDHHFNREDARHSNRKNHPPLNINNSNNNLASSRMAAIKSAKLDQKLPLNSILKSSSNRRRNEADIFKPSKVDIPDRLMDFDDDDDDEQILTAKERLDRMKKKEDVRRMISKQNFEQDLTDEDRPKRYHLQSILAEEAKEKSRQVAAQHHLNKSQQLRSIYPNA